MSFMQKACLHNNIQISLLQQLVLLSWGLYLVGFEVLYNICRQKKQIEIAFKVFKGFNKKKEAPNSLDLEQSHTQNPRQGTLSREWGGDCILLW